ncbi:hypothetical protein DWY99_09250 [[Clostridium] leptum]|uniref:Uncharacterized protein n=1 Tax=[Clostridium] leptum TaxID=1535 RepID=A0A412AWJ1_9FIRM|nr:hypothetical protein DWY99_09250 [[Clostridium] leptum]
MKNNQFIVRYVEELTLLKLETTIGNVAMPNAELNGVKLVAPKVVKNTSIGLDRKQDMKQAILNAQQSVKKLS